VIQEKDIVRCDNRENSKRLIALLQVVLKMVPARGV